MACFLSVIRLSLCSAVLPMLTARSDKPVLEAAMKLCKLKQDVIARKMETVDHLQVTDNM